jgi:hypothetical protein
MYILGSGKNPAELLVRGNPVFDQEFRAGEIEYGISGPCMSSAEFIDALRIFLEGAGK